MSEKKPMDDALRSLQEELDHMAEAVPPIPDSFRRNWREAIRREAASVSAASDSPASSVPIQSKSSSGVSEKRAASARGSFTWRRGLSIAAVFVFLLGGVLLGQDSVSFVRQEKPGSSTAAEAPVLLQKSEKLPLPTAAFTESPREMDSASEADTSFRSGSEMAETESMMDAAEFEEAVPLPDSEAEYPTGSAAADADEYPGTSEVSEAAEDSISAAAGSTASMNEITESARQKEDGNPSESHPLRIIGFGLVGLAFLLAAILLIFRK